jgi:hypothetical protein
MSFNPTTQVRAARIRAAAARPHAGRVIFPGWVPFSNLALSANVPGFIKAHEQALGYDFDTLVGGHVTRPGTPDDVRVQLEYMTDLRTTAEAALSSVDLEATMDPVDAGNVWAVFRAYLDAVAAQTADEIVPRWKDRLGGAGVFTLPNAWAMAESLRLDLNSMRPFGTVPFQAAEHRGAGDRRRRGRLRDGARGAGGCAARRRGRRLQPRGHRPRR